MTDIRIPASIDQRAADHLEEGTLIDFVLEYIRECGLTAEVRDGEAIALAVPVIDILVSSQPPRDWHWKVAVDTVAPGYTIYVQLFGGDHLTYIGEVNSFGALLAILLSGVDFDLPGYVMRFSQVKKGGVREIMEYSSISYLEQELAEAYSKGGCKSANYYIRATVPHYSSVVVMARDEDLTFIATVSMYDDKKDTPWDLSLGKVKGIAALIALRYTDVGFYGDLGPSFTDKDDTLYMDDVEGKSTEAYDEAKYQGNCLPICTRIANVLRGMGYSAVVGQYYQHVLLPEGATTTVYTNTHQVLIREGGTTTFTITALVKGHEEVGFDIHYHPPGGGTVISLGEVTTVALVVAVVCTGIDFKEQHPR